MQLVGGRKQTCSPTVEASGSRGNQPAEQSEKVQSDRFENDRLKDSLSVDAAVSRSRPLGQKPLKCFRADLYILKKYISVHRLLSEISFTPVSTKAGFQSWFLVETWMRISSHCRPTSTCHKTTNGVIIMIFCSFLSWKRDESDECEGFSLKSYCTDELKHGLYDKDVSSTHLTVNIKCLKYRTISSAYC